MYKSSVSVFAIAAMLSVAGANHAYAFFGDSDVYAEDVKPVTQERVQKEDAKKNDSDFEELKVNTPEATSAPEDLIANREQDTDKLPAFPRKHLSIGEGLGDGIESVTEDVTPEVKKLQNYVESQTTKKVEEVAIDEVPVIPPTTVAEDTVKETVKKTEAVKTLAPVAATAATIEKPIAPPSTVATTVASDAVKAKAIEPINTAKETVAKETTKVVDTATTKQAPITGSAIAPIIAPKTPVTKTADTTTDTTAKKPNDYIELSKVPSRPALTSAERAAQIKAELQKDLEHAKEVQADVAERGVDALDETTITEVAVDEVRVVPPTTIDEDVVKEKSKQAETIKADTTIIPPKSKTAEAIENAVRKEIGQSTSQNAGMAYNAGKTIPTPTSTDTVKPVVSASTIPTPKAETIPTESASLLPPPDATKPPVGTASLFATSAAQTSTTPKQEIPEVATEETSAPVKTATSKTPGDIRSRDVVVPTKELQANINAPRWTRTATEEQATDLVKKLENEKTIIRQTGVQMDIPTTQAHEEAVKKDVSITDIYSVTKTQENRLVSSGLPTVKNVEVPKPVLDHNKTLALTPENLSFLSQARTANTDRVRREIRSKDEVVQLSATSKAYKSSAAIDDASALVQQNAQNAYTPNNRGEIVSSLPTLPTQIDETGKGIANSSTYDQLVVEGKQPILEMPVMTQPKADLTPKQVAQAYTSSATLPTSTQPVSRMPSANAQDAIYQDVVSYQEPTYQAPTQQRAQQQAVNTYVPPVAAPTQQAPIVNAMALPTSPSSQGQAISHAMNGTSGGIGHRVAPPVAQQQPVQQQAQQYVQPVVHQQPAYQPPIAQSQYYVQQPQIIYQPQYYVVEVPVDQYGNPLQSPEQQIERAKEAQVAALAPTPTYDNVEAYKRPVRRRSSEAFVPMNPTQAEQEMMERKIRTTADQLSRIELNVRDVEEPLDDESARIPFNIR